ncbi:MAG: type II secretion system protein [Phycisphaerales bacterium]|nr:type II secretion system protein [Phycisphaerales bacterium]
MRPQSPSCPCLGTLGIGGPLGHVAGVIRNTGIIGCLLVGLIRPVNSPDAGTVDAARRVARRAFTLIELLVCIAIVAVLIAILLPALRGARAQAAIVKRISVVQQTGVALALYMDANAEVFPYMGTRGNPDAKLVLDHRPIEFTSPYFFQCALYINLISPAYAPIDPSLEVLVHEARPDLRDVLRSPLYLTQTAFAAPSYFGPFETPDDRSLYRPVRRAEMTFPSQKALLLDLRSGSHAEQGSIRWASNRVLVSMGDGSTRLREFVLDEENGNWSARSYYGLLICGMTTHNGIAGRDF